VFEVNRLSLVHTTGVLEWAGKLYALHESGLPHEMRPADLSTVGETDLDGSIEGKGPFAAHYRIMHQPDGSQR
jgi:carotenoid cleavage dioxygenase-like enzyme